MRCLPARSLPGGDQLDKKQKRKWKAELLQRLGAKPEKAPRMAARIGLGMAKKQGQREARALQEAIAAGTVRVKGMGKKKQALKGECHWEGGCSHRRHDSAESFLLSVSSAMPC
jgi:hypothetical protein